MQQAFYLYPLLCYYIVVIMHENGTIVEIFDTRARVEMIRSPACKTCGLCTSPLDRRSMILEVESVAEARVGDQVVVEIEPSIVLRSASIFYLIPLAGLFGGVIIGHLLFGREVLSLIFGLAGLVISFGLVFRLDRKVKTSHRFQPRIVEVIHRGGK
jgi:positive regulator of sigma E activity